jgi:hypothetical protein
MQAVSLKQYMREYEAAQPISVQRVPPSDEVQELLNREHQCGHCASEVRWDLKVAVAHDGSCPALRKVI